MDKNFIDKIKNFFRKEGFYIALFLCLCVIAAVGTFSYKKYSTQSEADKKDVSEVNIDLEGTSTTASIPENTTGYGSIEKLGGKSYKSENLLVLEDKAETTTNGITYSIKNGIITLNGTATAEFDLQYYFSSLTLNGIYSWAIFLNQNAFELSVRLLP